MKNFYLELYITIAKPIKELSQFIGNPKFLPQWTVHRALFYQNSQWYEVRKWQGRLVDASLQVDTNQRHNALVNIAFNWRFPNAENYQVVFQLEAISSSQTRVGTKLPENLSKERLIKMREVIQAELEILKAIHEGNMEIIPARHWHLLQSYHLSLYQ